MKKLYIVIINYQSWSDSIDCIKAIYGTDYSNYQVIIIDNNSPNDSVLKIREFLKSGFEPPCSGPSFSALAFHELDAGLCSNVVADLVSLISSTKLIKQCSKHSVEHWPLLFVSLDDNIGFGGGNNVALKAISEFGEDADILLLNPDVILDRSALSEVKKVTGGYREFICGMSVYYRDRPGVLYSHGGYRLLRPFGVPVSPSSWFGRKGIDFIYGASLFTNVATLRKAGVLPEHYFLYWEETDWCYAAKLRGIPLLIAPEAKCFDKIGSSIGRGYKADYYFTRNSIYFYAKYFPYFLPTLIIFHLIRGLRALMAGKSKNLRGMIHGGRDYLKGKNGRL